jgi:hypothetical protein
MLIRRLLPVVVMFVSGAAQACDCSPGSLAFQDAFFKYCDEARAAYEAAAPLAEEGGDRNRVAAAAEGEQQGGPGQSASQRPAR